MAENFDPNLAPPSKQPVVDPYGFIMNPPEKPNPKNIDPKQDFIKKIAILGGGGLLFIILIFVVMNLIFGGPTNIDKLYGVLQRQQEIIRISKNSYNIASPEIRNFAISNSATTSNQQSQLMSLVTSIDKAPKASTLELKKDTDNDTILDNAKSTNDFDRVFLEVILNQLKTYGSELKEAYDTSSRESTKSLLDEIYKTNQLQIKQADELLNPRYN